MSARDPFGTFLARMDALGFKPSSVLGQNFLLDPSLHRFLADLAGPALADTAVEIGVGLGFLTRELAARAGRVVAVEIDGRLLQLAREDLAAAANIEWVHGDALAGAGRSLHPAIAAAAPVAADGRVLLVANLPYAVSGPLLAEVCALPVLPARAVLLVQKEPYPEDAPVYTSFCRTNAIEVMEVCSPPRVGSVAKQLGTASEGGGGRAPST